MTLSVRRQELLVAHQDIVKNLGTLTDRRAITNACCVKAIIFCIQAECTADAPCPFQVKGIVPNEVDRRAHVISRSALEISVFHNSCLDGLAT